VPSLPRLAIPDIVADPDLIKRLVYEGETLYVERKERDPKDGLGATVASFANMLGGWLLIGVTNDRKIRRRFLREHPGHPLDAWPLPAD
jgi:hypothetical protein